IAIAMDWAPTYVEATLAVAPLSGTRRRSIASAETPTNGGFIRCRKRAVWAHERRQWSGWGRKGDGKQEGALRRNVGWAGKRVATRPWHWQGLRSSSSTICGEVTAMTISPVGRETWAETADR